MAALDGFIDKTQKSGQVQKQSLAFRKPRVDVLIIIVLLWVTPSFLSLQKNKNKKKKNLDLA